MTAHRLYRFFDADERLLYIGRTADARSRFRSHEKVKAWFDSVARIHLETFPSAEALAEAEVAAIKSECPLHNVVHNGGRNAQANAPLAPAIHDESGLHTARLVALGIRAVPESCGEPDIESGCECVACHTQRMEVLAGIEEEHSFDFPVIKTTQRLRQEYAAGYDLMVWVAQLLDIELLWPLQLGAVSVAFPVPALADVTETGLSVGCPYCLGCHEHFIASGRAIDNNPLQAPCSGGRYQPALDICEYYDQYDRWLERHFAGMQAVAS